MQAIRSGRTMQPRPQQGTSLLVAMQVLATDEGIYLARLAWKDAATSRTLVMFEDKAMWEGGVQDVEYFASSVAGGVQDVLEWVVS
jgi:hypothetical protein